MRFFFFWLLAFVSGCLSHAQTPLPENRYAMPAGKTATLKLPYARSINVRTWDKAELQFDVTIRSNQKELESLHRVNVEDDKDALVITTDFPKDSGWGKKVNCWNSNCDSTNIARVERGDCICLQMDYTILLPPGTSLSIETISGDVEVRGCTGNVRVKTISGFVDIDRQPSVPSDIDFHSVTGIFYTDFDLNMDKKSSSYDRRLKTSLNGGGQAVVAETVSGDIFFRKK
jgi:hypothetical protein